MILITALLVSVLFSFYWGVPFIPTSKKVVNAMIDIADLKGNEVIYDLGAGDGRFLVVAKKRFPKIQAFGVEVSPVVWLWSRIKLLFTKEKVDLRLGNGLKQDIANADCIFLYMITDLMPLFQKKFNDELRPGTKVVSHAFSFPGREAKQSVYIPGMVGKAKILLYEW